jgi:hypothetical protein
MGSSDIDPQINDEAESRDDLLSLDAEVKERLEDYYAEITFLERTSTAIHNHLQHDCHSSGPRDESEIASDAGHIDYDDSNNNEHYYDEDYNNGDAGDAAGEYDNDFQDEQIEDDAEGYEDWDDRDEYH